MVRFRWLVIVLAFVTFIVTASGGRFISFSNNARDFFSGENPQLKALETLENIYSKDDIIIIAVAPKDKNIFTPQMLALVEDLTEKCWQLPYSSRVDSITNYQHTKAEEDDLVVENLVKNPLNLSAKELAEIKEIALREPVLKNRLISPSGHVTGISVLFRLPADNSLATIEIVEKVRELVAKAKEKHPDVEFPLWGGVMINNAFGEASKDDIETLVPLMYIFMALVMWVMLRSISGTVSALIVIFASSITAMGLAGWLGIVLTPPSAMAPTIILTLAVADSVHILVTMLHEMRKGRTKHEAIIESMRLNMQPVFLTSITTAIGFLSMNFSDAPPFRDLGNIVAIGVMAAFAYSVTLLPALMALLPVKTVKVDNADNIYMDRFANFVVEKRNSLLWGMTFFILLIIGGISQVELNDLYLDYFDDRYQFRRDTDFINKNLTGISMVEYSLSSGEEGGISNPEYLNTLENFTQWLKEQPEVVQITNINDIMKKLNKSMHGDSPDWYKIPDNRDLAAQYLLLYEMSLPFGLDLNNMINVDKSATRFRITLTDIQNREIRAFEKRASGWLKENAPEKMHVAGTGISIMFAYINERNVTGMLRGTFIALLFISGILIFALKDIKIGLLSLIPNLVPAFLAFGLWGYTVSQIGLAVSVVAAMSLGIVVDDTVHFLSKYLRARREHNMDSKEAVRYSFHNVGMALVITSTILIVGFGILSMSGFKINANMGILTAIAITFALWVDFMLLPPILMKLDGNKKPA